MNRHEELERYMAALRVVEDLFDDVPDIVFFVKDADGRYVLANETLALRSGFRSKADVVGKRPTDLHPSPLGENYMEQDLLVLRGGEKIRDKLELQLYPGGALGWCLTNKAPIRGPEGAVIGMTGISRDLHIPGTGDKELEDLAASVAHIQKHYGEPLRVEKLAEMASLSTYQFEKRMKKIFHLTAGQFITRTRIDAACEQLERTGTAVAQIAVDCGFYDQSAFARQFKAATGLTPTQFRCTREAAP